MAMLIKKSIGMKAKIQMRMLGAVIVVYSMLIISGIFTTKTRKSATDIENDYTALLQKITN